jgi:hypothetical protein
MYSYQVHVFMDYGTILKLEIFKSYMDFVSSTSFSFASIFSLVHLSWAICMYENSLKDIECY